MPNNSSINKVLDEWKAVSPIGNVVPGTRFVAFKTPLYPELQAKALSRGGKASRCEWGASEVLPACPSLGLIIDLSATEKYCNLAQLQQTKGIAYKGIPTFGKAIPRKVMFEEFADTVDDFLTAEQQDEDKLIGVTCTYGTNRAGYYICQYMVKRMDIDPDEAIAAFNEARGHPMDQANYLKFIRTGIWERGY
jgi:atypical dual specificity phosphatase